MSNESENDNKYIPSIDSLKFIGFIRGSENESNDSPEVHYKIADALFSPAKRDRKVVIECTRGLGKALALSEIVYTEFGTKTISEVVVGDLIYDHTGKLTNVTRKSEVFHDETYEVEMVDGRVITVCKDHQWQIFDKVRNRANGSYMRKHIVSTEEIAKTQWMPRTTNSRNPRGVEQRYYLPMAEAIKYETKELPIDPYTLGVIIGDGSIDKRTGYSRVTSHNDDSTELFGYIPYILGKNSTPDKSSSFRGILGIGSKVKELGLNVNVYSKFIPEVYKRGSVQQRIELLQGLMDTDGTIDFKNNKSSHFTSASKVLATDVLDLARSLGAETKIHYKPNDYAGAWVVSIKHRGFNPFRLKRKADLVSYMDNADYQKIKEVRKVDTVPTQCITVDNEDHLFLTTGYTVTHNSTTVEYAVIYAAAVGEWPGFGKVPFIVFLGASQEGNVKQFFKNVANKIERSKLISSVLSVKRVTDNELELVNVNGVETMIVGRGMSTNFRGLRSKSGDRPTLVIADDILSNEVATSDAIRNTIDTNWYNSVLPALDPTQHKIIYIGTPISDKDLLSQLKNSGAYRVERYPLAPKFPCSESDFKSIWPDRFTYEYAADMYSQYNAAGKLQGFAQEYMLEMTDLATLLVDEDDVMWFDPASIIKNKSYYNFYISTDFATSTKKSADFSTIGVWALSSNNDWLLVDGQCRQQTMQDNIEDLFRYVKKWKPLSVGIESSGQQGGFLSIIDEMKMDRNIWFQFAKKVGSKEPGIRPTKDKVQRFVTGVLPRFKQNKIWFPRPEVVKLTNYRLFELVEEMVNELSKFTMSGGVKTLKHDDAIDLLNQLSEMDTYSPSEDMQIETSVVKDDVIWVGTIDDEDSMNEYNGSTIF